MKEFLKVIADGQTLTEEQATQAMHLMLEGETLPEETAAFLVGLRTRGETLDELVGFTRSMREHAVRVECEDPHAIDLCGTGGDSSGTFNISTAASFVCAGAGVTVAKHGNRSVSSKCGSADVLESLGIDVELQKEGVEYCLRETGIAFLFAPFFHPAMRHVMPVRKKLGVRTFFNILGPLCNPARVRRQLVGAFNTGIAEAIAHILARLDAEHVISVHSRDGMDEFSLSAPTMMFEYDADKHQNMTPSSTAVEPSSHDLQRITLDEIQGGTKEDNANILRAIFEGEKGPHRDIVLINAAYALKTSGKFDDVDACFAAARESIDSGSALRKMKDLAEASNEAP